MNEDEWLTKILQFWWLVQHTYSYNNHPSIVRNGKVWLLVWTLEDKTFAKHHTRLSPQRGLNYGAETNQFGVKTCIVNMDCITIQWCSLLGPWRSLKTNLICNKEVENFTTFVFLLQERRETTRPGGSVNRIQMETTYYVISLIKTVIAWSSTILLSE